MSGKDTNLYQTKNLSISGKYLSLLGNKYLSRWQWTAFLSAGSTAGYVYFYSFYYFFFKTKMYGFFQTTFYFGYMGVFSLGLGMLCGTVSYINSKTLINTNILHPDWVPWDKHLCEEDLCNSQDWLKAVFHSVFQFRLLWILLLPTLQYRWHYRCRHRIWCLIHQSYHSSVTTMQIVLALFKPNTIQSWTLRSGVD